MKIIGNGKKAVLEKLCDYVITGDVENCKKIAEETLIVGINPYDALIRGCAKGMKVVGYKYAKNEFFLPEVLSSASAFYAAVNILKPYLRTGQTRSFGTIVIGVCKGDIHDIGKNLVITLLESEGFTVYDLGKDVSPERFIEKAIEVNADVIAVSTLMSSTLFEIKKLINLLKSTCLKSKVKVIIGGASTTKQFAKEVGADAWAKDARHGVNVIKRLIKEKKA